MLATFKRVFLLLLLVLTGYAAVMIAAAVWHAGRTPEISSWAIEGTLAHGFLLLISFAAYTALDRPGNRVMALLGIAAAGAMFVLTPLFVAWRIRGGGLPQIVDVPREWVQVGLMTSALLCLIPFVLVPRMPRVGKIVQWTTIVYLTVAYIITSRRLLRIDVDRVEEAVITLLIPAGACMLGVYALHLFLGVRQAEPFTSVAPVIHVRCPRCQRDQVLGIGESRCTHCRLKISIFVEEPTCPNCHFNLHGLTRPVCPECGLQLDKEDVPENPEGLPAKSEAA